MISAMSVIAAVRRQRGQRERETSYPSPNAVPETWWGKDPSSWKEQGNLNLELMV